MDNFFYIDRHGVQIGPRNVDQIIAEGVLSPDLMVWKPGLSDWQRADQTEDFRQYLNNGAQTHNNIDTILPPPTRSSYQSTNNQYQTEQRYQQAGNQYNTTQTSLISKPQSWLIANIITTLFCCTPIGIVGIIYAAKSNNNWAQGKISESVASSKIARNLFIISLSLGIVSIIAYIIIYFSNMASMTNISSVNSIVNI